MAKFRGYVRGKSGKITSRLGHREIELTAQSWEGDVRVTLYQGEREIQCSIVVFEHGGTKCGRFIYQGALATLISTPHSLLEHMMFEHAQKMLMNEAA